MTEAVDDRVVAPALDYADHPDHWDEIVVGYYDKCFRDYRRGWSDRRSLGMHMGYWDKHTRRHSDSLMNMNRQVARRSGIRSGLRVLDAGCGVGGSSMWLAETFGVDVVGITLASDQVDRARRYAQRRGLDGRAQFLQRDFHATDFEDESFDVVWAQESVCHSLDKPAFFREAFRVLRPGGRLVIEDFLRRHPRDSVEDERLLLQWLHGWAVHELATGDEYRDWARAAGFERVALDDVCENMRPSARRLYLRSSGVYALAALRHPIRRIRELRRDGVHGLAESTPLLQDRRLRNWRGGRYQWKALELGLWFTGILSARKPAEATPEDPRHD